MSTSNDAPEATVTVPFVEVLQTVTYGDVLDRLVCRRERPVEAIATCVKDKASVITLELNANLPLLQRILPIPLNATELIVDTVVVVTELPIWRVSVDEVVVIVVEVIVVLVNDMKEPPINAITVEVLLVNVVALTVVVVISIVDSVALQLSAVMMLPERVMLVPAMRSAVLEFKVVLVAVHVALAYVKFVPVTVAPSASMVELAILRVVTDMVLVVSAKTDEEAISMPSSNCNVHPLEPCNLPPVHVDRFLALKNPVDAETEIVELVNVSASSTVTELEARVITDDEAITIVLDTVMRVKLEKLNADPVKLPVVRAIVLPIAVIVVVHTKLETVMLAVVRAIEAAPPKLNPPVN